MTTPTEPSSRLRNNLGLLMALTVLSAVIAVLSFLTLGFVGVLLGTVCLIVALMVLQYLLWGWWLPGYLQRQEARRAERIDSDAGATRD